VFLKIYRRLFNPVDFLLLYKSAIDFGGFLGRYCKGFMILGFLDWLIGGCFREIAHEKLVLFLQVNCHISAIVFAHDFFQVGES
jgi:hypothetical protein